MAKLIALIQKNTRLNGFFIATNPNINQGSGVLEPFKNVHVCQLTSGCQSLTHAGISLAGIGLAMP